MTHAEVVRKMDMAFSEWQWSPSFGGQAWANIAKGWLRLNRAKTRDELYVAIDHVYDLQHNTDTVFNKLKSYYSDGSHRWIKQALDFKANILSMQELIPRVSGSMKKIAQPFLQAIGDGPKETTKPNTPPMVQDINTQNLIEGDKYTITETGNIQALKDIPQIKVKKGDIGGYVSGYKNLSQIGSCWVYSDATVFGNATISNNAIVRGNVVVKGDAIVKGGNVVMDDTILGV